MFKRALSLTLLFLTVFFAWKQDSLGKTPRYKSLEIQVPWVSTAKTWPPGSKIPADSIVSAIERGENLDIENCEIFGPVKMKGTSERPDTINSFIQVYSCIFHDTVSFSYCHFTKSIIFSIATFNGIADFSHATFSMDAYFGFSYFKTQADFSYTTFYHKAYFTYSRFDKGVIFSHAAFRGQVDLWGTEYEYLDISWKQLRGHLAYDTRSNLKLMKNFEEERQLDDADGVYLFLKDQERMEKPKLQRYLEFWFIQQTCGYGIVWWRPLLTSLIVVMLFTFLYFKLVLQEKGLPLPNSGSKRFWKKLWNAFYYSMNTFLVGIPANWKVENKPKDFFVFRISTTIERTLGWILLAVFVVTLTRKFIR